MQLLHFCHMERAGAYTCMAEGVDRALKVLEAWACCKARAS